MNILRAALSAAFLLGGASAVQAATYTYDFKAAANSNGAVGEAAYSSFDTSSIFMGPGLTVTAGSDSSNNPYVYFDNGNAGLGVCNAVETGAPVNQVTKSGENICLDPGDDGLTTSGEYLTFTAVTDMVIESVWLNSNHDSSAPIGETVWKIGGSVYSAANGDFENNSVSQSGDIRIDLGFSLAAGEFFTVQGTNGPDSYLSAMAVTDVPLPAAGWMLLAGFGGLAALRRRKS